MWLNCTSRGWSFLLPNMIDQRAKLVGFIVFLIFIARISAEPVLQPHHYIAGSTILWLLLVAICLAIAIPCYCHVIKPQLETTSRLQTEMTTSDLRVSPPPGGKGAFDNPLYGASFQQGSVNLGLDDIAKIAQPSGLPVKDLGDGANGLDSTAWSQINCPETLKN